MEEVVLRLGMINDRILMEQYGISNQEKEFFVNELRFIKLYRRKLYDLLNLLYETLDDGDIEKINNLQAGVSDLTRSIVGFISDANGYNLSRKILFAKNIDMEIKEVLNDIKLRTGDGRNYKELLNHASYLNVFLQYVASETLMRGDRYVEVEEEQTRIVSDKLIQKIKKNFLDYIKENDLTKTDVLFLIGYAAQKRDDASDTYAKTPEHCEGCTRDDCMLPSVCEHNSEKTYVPSIKSKYDGVVQSLKNFVKGTPLSGAEKEHIVSSLNDPRARQLAKKIVEGQPSGKRTFAPNLDEGAWAMVNEMNVKNALRKMLKNKERIDIENVNENVIGLIINNMDFTKATAEQSSMEFLKNYFKVMDTITQMRSEDEKKNAVFEGLLRMYEETLKEIKIEKGE